MQNGTAFIQGYSIAPDEDITGTAVPSSVPSSTSECAATTTAQSSTKVTATGLGVGLGVGLLLLAAIGVLSFLLLREKKRGRHIGTHRSFAGSIGQIGARPSILVESPRTESGSLQVEPPRTGFGELPNSQFVEAGVGQERKAHELYGKEHPQVAELSSQEADLSHPRSQGADY